MALHDIVFYYGLFKHVRYCFPHDQLKHVLMMWLFVSQILNCFSVQSLAVHEKIIINKHLCTFPLCATTVGSSMDPVGLK
jgi:hypothetical protein